MDDLKTKMIKFNKRCLKNNTDKISIGMFPNVWLVVDEHSVCNDSFV